MKKFLSTVFALVLLAVVNINAQTAKVGYINTQELISQLPEVKVANDSIESLRKKWEVKISSMINELRAKAISLESKKNETAPVQYQKEVELLQSEEKSIMDMEKLGQQQVLAKTDGLLNPIQSRINEIIKAVATEEGYSYVIDNAQGVLLYADKSVDITTKVKERAVKK
jgi:outer membrane protein